MDARKIRLVQQSFEKVAAIGVPAAEVFYAELFAIDPSLQPMFSNDMGEQQKKLMSALTLVIRSLDNPEKIIPPVQRLAVKHLDYGVLPEHYTFVGNALLLPFKHLRAAPTHPAWRTQQRYAWRRTRCRRNDLLIAGFINCTADIGRRTQNPTLPSPDQIRLLIIID
jgi:hemoglobin-like flavoprotein